MADGTLYLMPVWLGDHGGAEMMPQANMAIAARTNIFFCEREKTARQMLRRMLPEIDLNAIQLFRLDQDTTEDEIDDHVALLAKGDAVILSEAGMPCIADPGARLVAAAHRKGMLVVPLSGPSSILLALAASGLNGQNFTFHGYLPRESSDRKAALRRLDQEVQRTGAAQIFIETPYRNDVMLADILRSCTPNHLLCLAVDIDQPGAMIQTRSIKAWRERPAPLGKRPAVFILGK